MPLIHFFVSHVRQTCFAYNLFCAFFKNFFSVFFITFLKKTFFLGHISTFSNFEAKRAKNGAKNKKPIKLSKCVCVLNFLLKSQIRCTLMWGMWCM
jgi:hypothetical protein